MLKKKAIEPQNQVHFDEFENKGPISFGTMTSYIYRHDPKHIGFLFARYKFAAKMLWNKKEVLEVGCGDALATPIIAQSAKKVYCLDFEPLIEDINRQRLVDFPNIEFHTLDILKKPFFRRCNGVVSLDVIEHIEPKHEAEFMKNIVASMTLDGVCVIGTPNIEAHRYASQGSREGHINLKSYKDFEVIIKKYFENGFIFSMNDEVVHTGFYPMAHYLFMVGVGVRKNA